MHDSIRESILISPWQQRTCIPNPQKLLLKSLRRNLQRFQYGGDDDSFVDFFASSFVEN